MHIEDKDSTKPKIRLKRRITAAKNDNNVNVLSGSQSTHVTPPSECNNNPVDRLCRKLLDWDIIGSDKKEVPLPTLPMTFDSYRSYVNIWEPLLIAEMKANILSGCPISSFETNLSTCSLQLPSDLGSGRLPLVYVQATFPLSTGGTDEKRSNRSAPQSSVVVYMDLLLLTEVPPPPPPSTSSSKPLNDFINISRTPLKAPPGPAPPPPPKQCFLALVTSQPLPRSGQVTLSLHRQRVIKVIGEENSSRFTEKQYTCKVLSSLVSVGREFLALHEAHRMPLLPLLLQPSTPSTLTDSAIPPRDVVKKELCDGDGGVGADASSSSSEKSHLAGDEWRMEGVGPAFQRYLHSAFNPSQRRAIQCAVERRRGFSLIQGPPGTGNIHTPEPYMRCTLYFCPSDCSCYIVKNR